MSRCMFMQNSIHPEKIFTILSVPTEALKCNDMYNLNPKEKIEIIVMKAIA